MEPRTEKIEGEPLADGVGAIDPAVLECWRRRWRVLKDIQTEKTRRMTIDQRFQEMCSLYADGKAFGWTDAPEKADPRAREPWMRLRAAFRG